MRDPKEVFGKTGIVCPGGGFRGACLPTGFKAVVDREIPISYLGGTSVASFMLARLSETSRIDAFDEMRQKIVHMIEIWDRIEKEGPQTVFDFSYRNIRVWNSEAILPDEKALFWLAEYFDPVKSINSPIRYDTFVFNETTQMHEVISNHDQRFRGPSPIFSPDDLRKFQVASARLGPIFKALVIGGQSYYDGGFSLLSEAQKYGCETIFFFCPYPKKYFKPKADGYAERFIEEHLPVMTKTRERYAALLRNREHCELEMLEAHNASAKEILRRDKKIQKLESEVENLKEQFSKDEKILHFVGKAWEKFLDLPKVLGEIAAQKKSRIGRPIRLIKIWSEPPQTLTVTNFHKGDFKIARDRFEEMTKRKIDRYLDVKI